MAGRGGDSGDRRSAIGRHALEVLAARGLRGFTHRAVDAAAGLGPGSVNYHAPTRDRLLDLAIDALVDEDLRATHEVAATIAGRPPAATLVDLLAGVVDAACTPQARHRAVARHLLFGEALQNPRVDQRLRAHRRQVVDLAETMFREQGFGPAAAEADLVLAVLEGMISRQVVTPAAPLPDPVMRRAIADFLARLGIAESAH